MNRTTKAKYDMATRMLKGRIDPEEVALMTDLPLAEVEKLKEDVVPNNPDADVIKRFDNPDLDIGNVIYDNNPDEEVFVTDYPGAPKKDNE